MNSGVILRRRRSAELDGSLTRSQGEATLTLPVEGLELFFGTKGRLSQEPRETQKSEKDRRRAKVRLARHKKTGPPPSDTKEPQERRHF